MGYTHYWTQQRAITPDEWANICAATRVLFEMNSERGPWDSIRVTSDYDESDPPEITDGVIRFNGFDIEGHETFFLTNDDTDFCFCKTARKPYDVFVVAVLTLCEIYAPGGWDISSDGSTDEWMPGMTLAHAAADRAEKWPNDCAA